MLNRIICWLLITLSALPVPAYSQTFLGQEDRLSIHHPDRIKGAFIEVLKDSEQKEFKLSDIEWIQVLQEQDLPELRPSPSDDEYASPEAQRISELPLGYSRLQASGRQLMGLVQMIESSSGELQNELVSRLLIQYYQFPRARGALYPILEKLVQNETEHHRNGGSQEEAESSAPFKASAAIVMVYGILAFWASSGGVNGIKTQTKAGMEWGLENFGKGSSWLIKEVQTLLARMARGSRPAVSTMATEVEAVAAQTGFQNLGKSVALVPYGHWTKVEAQSTAELGFSNAVQNFFKDGKINQALAAKALKNQAAVYAASIAMGGTWYLIQNLNENNIPTRISVKPWLNGFQGLAIVDLESQAIELRTQVKVMLKQPPKNFSEVRPLGLKYLDLLSQYAHLNATAPVEYRAGISNYPDLVSLNRNREIQSAGSLRSFANRLSQLNDQRAKSIGLENASSLKISLLPVSGELVEIKSDLISIISALTSDKPSKFKRKGS